MSAPQSKPELRRWLTSRIASLSAVERSALDIEIRGWVSGLRAFRDAKQLLAYVAFRDEPNLEPLMIAAWREGKQVFVPEVETGGGLRFVAWVSPASSRECTWGSATPFGPGQPEYVPSLVLVPGRGFDPLGHRLGRGRGSYDRAMLQLRSLGPTLGVAYECQILATVPREPHDAPVDAVVTEKGVRYADPSEEHDS